MMRTGDNDNDETLDAEGYWRWVGIRRLTINTGMSQQKIGHNSHLFCSSPIEVYKGAVTFSPISPHQLP